jgi:hypothetical protein
MDILRCVDGHNRKVEGLGKLKKSDDLSGNPTRDFPACRIVSLPNLEYKNPQREHKKYEQ